MMPGETEMGQATIKVEVIGLVPEWLEQCQYEELLALFFHQLEIPLLAQSETTTVDVEVD